MRIGIIAVLGSGVLLFFGEPMKLYGNPSFSVKMALLFCALLLQLTLFRKVRSEASSGSAVATIIGTLTLLLWFGVGLAGRAGVLARVVREPETHQYVRLLHPGGQRFLSVGAHHPAAF